MSLNSSKNGGPLDDFEVICTLGRGSFGSVAKVFRKSDSKIMVWKEIDYFKMIDREKQQLVQEVNLLQKMRHPHIVRYYDRIVDRDNGKLYIIMEYCKGGDLAELILNCKKEKVSVSEETIWKTLTQLCLAMSDCHLREDGIILHRDIKPGNVFLDEDNNIKLGDFGLARVLSKDSLYAHTYLGTPYYMSPEQIAGQPYNEKCDIWSLGCLIYELASLKPPFDADSHPELNNKIESGKYPPIPSRYSDSLSKAISHMLIVDPKKRMNVEELLKLPQLSIRVRERQVNLHYNLLKKKEEEIRRKENALADREESLNRREESIKQRENLHKSTGSISSFGDLSISHSKSVSLSSTNKENYPYRNW